MTCECAIATNLPCKRKIPPDPRIRWANFDGRKPIRLHPRCAPAVRRAGGWAVLPTGTTLIVMTSAAQMPANVKSEYRHVAVLETYRGVEPAMISARARGVVRVVWKSGPQYVGKTDRCAYAQAIRHAEALAGAGE